jgi:hypothetical protein
VRGPIALRGSRLYQHTGLTLEAKCY